MKFKIKGDIVEELPELDIEANNKKEAEEFYLEKYEKGEIEGDEFIEYNEEENENEMEDEYNGAPRIIEKCGKHFQQDILGISDFPIEESKIYNIKDEELPEREWDSIEYLLYYEQRGYKAIQGGDTKKDNAMNILYQKIKNAIFCIDCKAELTDFDLQKVKEGNRCIKCQSPIWTRERKELKEKAEEIARELSKNDEFVKLPNASTKREWVKIKFPLFKLRSNMIVQKANSLIIIQKIK
jgi:DNA-directed RNA polymerase subunit RPC12/RpoP